MARFSPHSHGCRDGFNPRTRFSATAIHANTVTSANAVLRPMVASATASTAATAVSRETRVIAATRFSHHSASVPAVVPWADTAGRNAARHRTCSTYEITNAGIAAE